MEGQGLKLAAMLAVGWLMIIIGLTGKLGSVLGSIIDPANMTGSSSTSSSPGNPGSVTGIASMIQNVFGPYGADAVKIAQCESGVNASAVNPQGIDVYGHPCVGGANCGHATGVFQIVVPMTWNSTSYASGDPKDAMTNIKAAYELFVRNGKRWQPLWACASKVGLQ